LTSAPMATITTAKPWRADPMLPQCHSMRTGCHEG
jgi:hypothetical protein